MNKPAPKRPTRTQKDRILYRIADIYARKESVISMIRNQSSPKEYFKNEGMVVEVEHKVTGKLQITITINL